jgi:hypothetical protein
MTVIPLGARLPVHSSNLPGSDASHVIAPLFGLAPDGVYHAVRVATSAVRSYRTISPLPDPLRAIGGMLSVALSIASRRPVVNRHPALRSPDFPLRNLKSRSDCLSSFTGGNYNTSRKGNSLTKQKNRL